MHVFVDVGCRSVLIRDHKLLHHCTMSHGRKSFGQNAQCCISECHTQEIKNVTIFPFFVVCVFFNVPYLHRLIMLLFCSTDPHQWFLFLWQCWHVSYLFFSGAQGRLWWLIISPVSWTSLFLFLYVLAMTEFTHPSEHSHLYLTLRLRLTGT